MKVTYRRRTEMRDVKESITLSGSHKKLSLDMWRRLLRTAYGIPHSPIRAVEYRFFIRDIPSWVATHLCRHNVGVTPYIKSQRTDYTGVERSTLSQSEPVNMVLDCNANSLINIAKARLCKRASRETRQVVLAIKNELLTSGDPYDTITGESMMAPCQVYGECFEIKPC